MVRNASLLIGCGVYAGLAGERCRGRFGIFAGHFVVNDGVPRAVALGLRHVVFACPTAEFEFFDEIELRCGEHHRHGKHLKRGE